MAASSCGSDAGAGAGGQDRHGMAKLPSSRRSPPVARRGPRPSAVVVVSNGRRPGRSPRRAVGGTPTGRRITAHSDGRPSIGGFAPKRRKKARCTTEAHEQTKGDCNSGMAHYRSSRCEVVQRDHDPKEDRTEKYELKKPVVLVLQHEGSADWAPARTLDASSRDPVALGVKRTGAGRRPGQLWSLRIPISPSIPHHPSGGRTDANRQLGNGELLTRTISNRRQVRYCSGRARPRPGRSGTFRSRRDRSVRQPSDPSR